MEPEFESSERRILTVIGPYIPIVSNVLYRSWDRYMREDAPRIPGAIERSVANIVWEYNRLGLLEAFAEYPSKKVEIITEERSIDCVFDEQFVGRIKKSNLIKPSRTRTPRYQAFERQECIDGIPESEHFYITWHLNDLHNDITVHICYPSPSGYSYEWTRFIDKAANISSFDTLKLPFDQKRQLPLRPKEIRKQKNDINS